MSFLPYAVLWVGLVVAAVVCLATERRPGLRLAVILVVFLPAFVLWLLFRPDTVLPTLNTAGRVWTITPVAWSLTGIALLLALAALFPSFTKNGRNPARQTAMSLALTAAVLPALWAGDGRTRLLGMAFFAVVWGFASWSARPHSETTPGEWRFSIGRVFFALFPLWASILLPDQAVLWAILAAAILMNAWPVGNRSARFAGLPIDALLRGLPILAGAAVLADPIASAGPRPVEIAVGSAVGLIGFAVGLARAWERPSELAEALGMALAGVVFVAAIWAGVGPLLASVRLAIFAPLLLSHANGSAPAMREERAAVASRRAVRELLSPAMLSRGMVYVAVAGLPLTVGFAVFAPLYDTWRVAGGWVLLLVVVLLLTFWLAAILARRVPSSRGARSSSRNEWLMAATWLPCIVGLISLDLSGLAVGPITWLAVGIPPVAGLLVGRYAPSNSAFGDIWREAIAIPAGSAGIVRRLRVAGRLIAEAASDALAIISGDYGLLWLVGLLLLLLWIA